MTNTELAAAIQLAEKDRRRARTEQGRGPVQHTKRQRNKKAFHKGGRNNWKKGI